VNILHATTDPTLLTRLKETLKHTHKADIAVGYLFISGFNEVTEELSKLEKTRVLVGKVDRPTLDEIARSLQQADTLQERVTSDNLVPRTLRAEIGTQAVTTIGEGVSRLPQTADAEASIQRMCHLIAAGKLEIKTYPRGVLHAKAYLCWYKDHAEPGSAIVGSSNFTLAGFTNNTELNVRVTGDAEMAELKRWFDTLWANSIDITQELVVELQRSWPIAQTPPYHVYLKALYELYKDELGMPTLEPQKHGAPQLANFQLDAVRRALNMVDKHGGCFIGDVVGLGKTYIGAELVRQLLFNEPRGIHPLIICPASLKSMWENFSELFSLGAQVISMSAIMPPKGDRYDEAANAYVEDDVTQGGIDLQATYPNRGVVLVDEVHNFRNPSSRRYQALSRYLWDSSHKVVLLSATPQNLGPADIYNQLRLFLDDVEHGLDIEPRSLKDYFNLVQKAYQQRIDRENALQDTARMQASTAAPGSKKARAPKKNPEHTRPSDTEFTMGAVLSPVFVRRRRKDIQELYGANIEVAGKPVRFPDAVLDNVTYRLDKVYQKAGSIAAIQEQLKGHTGARYRPLDYLQPAAKQKERYKDLLRAKNRIAGLVRYLLFKRLESSVAAFRSTLDVLCQSNRNFVTTLQANYVPVGQTASGILAGEHVDADDLLTRLHREETRRIAKGAAQTTLVHPGSDFNITQWIADLDADYAILAALKADVEQITPADDDKLQALKHFLARPDVHAGKVLIFTEAETTVDYLYDQLNPHGTDTTIARLSGKNRDAIESIVRRFAPTANARKGETITQPISIVIATDVISEGQNLQDCNRVLNYDLHWNPVRLIQRFGRVDRIGTTHEKIYLHNTWPDTHVDAQLSLTERLHQRIQAFHDFIGLDAPLLSDTERINTGAMYRIYEEKRLPDQDDVLDEVAAYQRGIALLQKLQQDDPELWKTITHLPDGIRSALSSRATSGPSPAPNPDAHAAATGATPAAHPRGAQSSLFGAPTEQLTLGSSPPAGQGSETVVGFDSFLGGGGAQQPLFEPPVVQLPLGAAEFAAAVEAPRAPLQPDETVILFKHGDRAATYAVGSDHQPRIITPTQLITAMECTPDTPALPLPADTNERVMAAYTASRQNASTRLGAARRPMSDTRLRRYLATELKLASQAPTDESDDARRIRVLRQIFLGHLPAAVQSEVDEVYRMRLTSDSLIKRLDALRERHRLSAPGSEDTAEPPTVSDVVRIICSDAVVNEHDVEM